jgi:hypothetical protein
MAERPKGYGLTAEIQDALDAKYDANLEGQAREWLEQVVGQPFPSGSFHEALRNGVYLCKAMNVLQPGSVPKTNESKMAFKMMENIGNFLNAAGKYGVVKNDLFQTVDLFEAANIPQVINGIHALGRAAQKNGFSGPRLGAKESTKQARGFDEAEQRKAGQSVIGLQMGSNRGASQAGMTPYGLGRQVEKTNLKN